MALVTRNIWKGTDMGSRLGVLIKQHDGWEMHYDHWAAQTIGADIALDGFEATMQRVRQMEPLGIDTPFEWNQGPLVEGALLIDQTNNTVVWVEESDGLYLPRIINALVERTWPGWTAVWSAEGKDGVLAAAGVDPDPLFTPFDTRAERWRTLHGSAPGMTLSYLMPCRCSSTTEHSFPGEATLRSTMLLISDRAMSRRRSNMGLAGEQSSECLGGREIAQSAAG
ncbi:hypothetical protein, partial [Propionibacterium freudenreichii]